MPVKLDVTNFADLFNGSSTSLLLINCDHNYGKNSSDWFLMALLCSVVSFIAFSVHFMFSLIDSFWTSPNETQHCYIGEGATAAVVQQRTLLFVHIFLSF